MTAKCKRLVEKCAKPASLKKYVECFHSLRRRPTHGPPTTMPVLPCHWVCLLKRFSQYTPCASSNLVPTSCVTPVLGVNPEDLHGDEDARCHQNTLCWHFHQLFRLPERSALRITCSATTKRNVSKKWRTSTNWSTICSESRDKLEPDACVPLHLALPSRRPPPSCKPATSGP